MPGFLLHIGAQVMCSHGGQGTPVVVEPSVQVGGQPITTIADPYVIAGCPLPPVAGGPCVTGMFIVAATRITAYGQPVLLLDSMGICAPTGVPLLAVAAQTRVTGI